MHSFEHIKLQAQTNQASDLWLTASFGISQREINIPCALQVILKWTLINVLISHSWSYCAGFSAFVFQIKKCDNLLCLWNNIYFCIWLHKYLLLFTPPFGYATPTFHDPINSRWKKIPAYMFLAKYHISPWDISDYGSKISCECSFTSTLRRQSHTVHKMFS